MLAGSRAEGDPLAVARRARHRALLDVAGTPMLLRVLDSLCSTPSIAGLQVSIDDPNALDGIEAIAALLREGRLALHTSLDSPSRSVLDALGSDAEGAVLLTTADHALLTVEMLDHFLARAAALEADVCVGVVSQPVVEARFPGVPRTWLPFRDGRVTGANLFVLRAPAALAAVEFWIRAESFRKQPWRIAGSFGPVSLLLFALRRLTLDAALARASRTIGCRIEAVRLPFAEAAVDVDKPSDLALAEQVLADRVAAPSGPDR